MKMMLLIIVMMFLVMMILLINSASAQMVSVLGKDKNNVTRTYSPTALPIPTQAATRLKNHSDSLKTVYALVRDLTKQNKVANDRLTIAITVAKNADSVANYLTKRNKILTDSLKLTYKVASQLDSTVWKNLNGKGTKASPYEVICPCK